MLWGVEQVVGRPECSAGLCPTPPSTTIYISTLERGHTTVVNAWYDPYLRHPFWRNEAAGLDRVKTGLRQSRHQLDLRLRGYTPLLVLQAISGADLNDTNMVCRYTRRARECSPGEMSESLPPQGGGEQGHGWDCGSARL